MKQADLFPFKTVDGAIIGIVGTAPMGAVNQLTLCQTKKDFAQFGTLTGKGFTLPDAFEILSRYASGQVYVVNVLDPTRHKTQVNDEGINPRPKHLNCRNGKSGIAHLNGESKQCGSH
ncbi:tail sheath-like protein [Avibacterium paragallinarum]|uniref:Tail sheath-like protein n=1 Tax=Avibacterium paragallinarum TaxID=728 RepID=A0A377I6S9_AVIPA|nr:tail sheath-like protein [Avibacterium paragallinarum]